ncbi:MAG: type II secretion system protein M [Deltaproteobacteria bacterium]|nr:type II secretion system protein M [Deltaproteobacteria bacterium]
MAFGGRLDELKASFERLSARERLMVLGLGLTVALGVVVGVGYWIGSSLDELEERNADLRKALKDVAQYRGAYLQHRRRLAALEVRMSRTPLELNSYVEKAASSVGVKIDESGEMSPLPGDQYVQRALEVKLRKVNIAQLAALLKKLEEEPAHIVQVTRLSVNTRYGQNQDLDVELTVSTYDRAPAGKGKEAGSDRKREPS